MKTVHMCRTLFQCEPKAISLLLRYCKGYLVILTIGPGYDPRGNAKLLFK